MPDHKPPVPTYHCPRCEADWIDQYSPTSRVTRDDGAAVAVCTRCGDKESLRDFAGVEQEPLTAWPLSDDDFAAEELWRRSIKRKAVIRTGPITDLHLEGED